MSRFLIGLAGLLALVGAVVLSGICGRTWVRDGSAGLAGADSLSADSLSGRGITWAVLGTAIDRRFPSVRHLAPEALAAWRADASRPAPVLLDVRTADEYAVSHLPGALRVDPDASAADVRALLDRHLDANAGRRPLVLYCAVGYRSSALAARLHEAERAGEAAFGPVYNLRGAIFGWANAGYAVVRDGQRVEDVHPYDRLWSRLLAPHRRADTPC
jgi:rhodanese-related sulfurtransferase